MGPDDPQGFRRNREDLGRPEGPRRARRALAKLLKAIALEVTGAPLGQSQGRVVYLLTELPRWGKIIPAVKRLAGEIPARYRRAAPKRAARRVLWVDSLSPPPPLGISFFSREARNRNETILSFPY